MSVFTNEEIVTGDVTVSAGVNVNNFPVTQPVSGTVSVSNFPATQNVAVTSSVEVEVKNDSGSAIPVTGPLTDTQLRATPVPVTSGSLATAAVSLLAVGPTVLTALASVSTRAKFILYNETGTLFIKLGSGASATDYSMRLTANTSWEFSGYSGIVTVIKSSGTSNLLVTSIH